jgi:hypothetical protein
VIGSELLGASEQLHRTSRGEDADEILGSDRFVSVSQRIVAAICSDICACAGAVNILVPQAWFISYLAANERGKNFAANKLIWNSPCGKKN